MTRRAAGLDSVGFASFQMAWLAALALLLHETGFVGASGRTLALAVGSTALLLAPFFPLYAVLSPEPANGAKLLVFPAATFLAVWSWLPPSIGAHGPAAVRWLLVLGVAGNAAVIAAPALGATKALRGKRIEWRAGGPLFLAVLALAAAQAAVAVSARVPEVNPAPAIAAIVLAVVFQFFLATRISTSPRAILAGLVLAGAAIAGGFALGRTRVPLDLPAGDLVSAALVLGALYALCHVERAGHLPWVFLASILALGAAAPAPLLALALVVPSAVVVVRAVRTRRPAPAFGGVTVSVAAFLAAPLSIGRVHGGDPSRFLASAPGAPVVLVAGAVVVAALAAARARDVGDGALLAAFGAMTALLVLLGAGGPASWAFLSVAAVLAGSLLAPRAALVRTVPVPATGVAP